MFENNENSQPTEALTPQFLLEAYASGYFPMADDAAADELFWLSPEMRGVMPLEKLHISKSLVKCIKNHPFEIRYDSAFINVMNACAEPTSDRPQTWINDEIINIYSELFLMGLAHSVEIWNEDKLVGGLYGVQLGAAFFGESMFSRETNASKIAFVHLVKRLKFGGFKLLDTQFTTKHLENFGVIEIPKTDYLLKLDEALHHVGNFEKFPANGNLLADI
ncbi:MAG: leucyl/phenylalanyl-tRNA--protein transferase [Hyphomicrobiales bacterium]|nr:MAG: leucyl/phenylalanyl-tRNA--protein transferase [Hyphomicrobiales bacterium]